MLKAFCGVFSLVLLVGCTSASHELALAAHPDPLLISLPRICAGDQIGDPAVREYCLELAKIEAERAKAAAEAAAKAQAAQAANPCRSWFMAPSYCYGGSYYYGGGRGYYVAPARVTGYGGKYHAPSSPPPPTTEGAATVSGYQSPD